MSYDRKAPSTAGVETFDLFRMQPDVPFDRAFEELSVLLGCIRHLTVEAEMENDRIAGSAARILSTFAKAIINDMETGMNRFRNSVDS
ncbi:MULTISPECIES: DUF3077 domain-containing protein [Pseudomonas]|uniref:DUF3077 domain-containing protein n=1 Tax=Pseudomonas putida TaxID=303 RepID=A0A1B2FCR5_PSEPU|nr:MULTISPECIES: DUF3077 domain-containing protein [Pseudomonas]ANY90000.1 hypothetical protein IEC33019_4494 [Pseudomonas putida]MCL8307087.1 DUF3077 domain-containing protein [Pseudomonas putida]